MADRFEEELARRQSGASALAAPVQGDDKFSAELSRRGLNAAPNAASLQQSGQPVQQGFAATNRAIANTIGETTDLLNKPPLSVFNAPQKIGRSITNRLGLTEGPLPPLPGPEETRAFFRKLGVPDVKPREEQTRSEQIATAAGDVFGTGLTLLAPAGLGVKGLSKLPAANRFLAPIVRQMETKPLQFAATELSMLAGSAQGAGIAEAIAPDNELAKFAGEIFGGFVNPTSAVIRGAASAPGAAGRLVSSFTRAGRERTAAKVLQNLAIEAGEDPKQLAAALRASDVVPTQLTSGVKTGSEAMLRLEASVARDSAKFERTSEKATSEAFENIRGAIEKLAATGDPESLRMAASLRQEFFDGLLQDRFLAAQTKAMEAAARIGGPGRGEASRRVQQTIADALSEARNAEAALWRNVPQTRRIGDTSEIASSVATMRQRLLKEEKLPFQSTFDRILSGRRAPTSGELITLRSRLLSESRRLRASQDFGMANISSELADGVLRQLDALPTTAFDEARAFSRALNENFTQTFANQAVRSERTGGARTPPEVLLDRAFAGGGEGASLRFRELESAGGFVDPLFAGQVRNAEEQFIRSAASETIENGVVNPAKLASFVKKNAQTLQRFPAAAADLQDAQRASALFQQTEAANQTASRIIRQKAVFSKLLNVEDATEVVGRALKGPQPVRQINELTRLARRSGPGAVGGLRTSIIDSAVERASAGQGLSFQKLDAILKEPVARGGPDAYGLIASNNLMAPDELQRLRHLVSRGAQIESNIATGFRREELIDSPDALTDLVIRIAGARLGARGAQGAAAGSSLVAAGAGSRFLRGLLEKVPASRTQDVLIEAAQNPRFAAKLLEKPRTERARRELASQLNVFLLQAGIIADEEGAGDSF